MSREATFELKPEWPVQQDKYLGLLSGPGSGDGQYKDLRGKQAEAVRRKKASD